MFVNTRGVPVYLPEDENKDPSERNVIYIKEKMGLGSSLRVSGASVNASGTNAKDVRATVNIGAYQIALLRENILRWEGPAFKGRPCNSQNIELLDGDDPLVKLVRQRIAERNTAPKPPAQELAADPN